MCFTCDSASLRLGIDRNAAARRSRRVSRFPAVAPADGLKPFWMALTDLDAPHAWHTQFERRVFGSLISCVSEDLHIWQITYSMK